MGLDEVVFYDPQQFLQNQFKKHSKPSEVAMRHSFTHFSHMFEYEHYASQYYVYRWAEVLAADAFEAFDKITDEEEFKSLAARLYRYVYSVGDAIDPEEAYREFMGRDPDPNALMRTYGFMI